MQKSQLKYLLILVFAGVISGGGWICTATMVKYNSAMLVTGQRFLISGLLLSGLLLINKKPRNSLKMHLAFMAQGLFAYCVYCSLAAFATKFIVSGLVAVIVTLMFVVNACLERIFFQKAIRLNVIIGGLLAVCGVIILIQDDILSASNSDNNTNKVIGLFSAFGSVLAFSIGSIISKSISMRGTSVLQTTVFSMIYGSLICILIEFITSDGQILPSVTFETKYLTPLFVIGLFIAPTCYVSYNYLIKNVGAAEASFIFIISPVVALIISAYVEGLRLDYKTVVATMLTITGTVITIMKPGSKH